MFLVTAHKLFLLVFETRLVVFKRFARVIIGLGLEERVGNPKVDYIQDSRKENHDKDEFKANVKLNGRKQNSSKPGQWIRTEPHKEVYNHLDNGLNDEPSDALTNPVPNAVGARIHARVLQVSPVSLMGGLVEQVQKYNGQDKTERRINQVGEAVPGALIQKDRVSANVLGND